MLPIRKTRTTTLLVLNALVVLGVSVFGLQGCPGTSRDSNSGAGASDGVATAGDGGAGDGGTGVGGAAVGSAGDGGAGDGATSVAGVTVTSDATAQSASSSGGVSGTAGASGLFVDQLYEASVDKVDLLFVIDNSLSMADKQALLSIAVPALVQRLVNPDCVIEDEQGNVIDRQPASGDPNAPCSGSYQVEFDPVDDMHIAVITSSLGGHGGDVCSPAQMNYNETKNDRGHLLPSVRLGLPDTDDTGFLVWDPAELTQEQLAQQLLQHVVSAGEQGCGHEAPLEAWYRFLIDPSPPQDMVNDGAFAYPVKDANGDMIVDTVVLQQRAAFLRPDSAVAIIMLTDENDCSVIDGGLGWLTAQFSSSPGLFNMPSATIACAVNPNHNCCRSCALNEAAPPAGCQPLAQDVGCVFARNPITDSLNLRCYEQKRRFGLDLLYPIERYVDGLSKPVVTDHQRCDDAGCPEVPNPLFWAGGATRPRDPSLVFLAGIVGVPWQDIATPETLDTTNLEYMTASELVQHDRWPMILGTPEAANPMDPAALPSDPLMIETSDPRNGVHPITGQSLAPTTSVNPQENVINGHEYVNNDFSDLQYACIFPLDVARDCSPNGSLLACDCTESDLPKNRPLCNPPGGGPAGLSQHYAKAYPGLRLLHVLRDFGDNAIVASICPKATTVQHDEPSFGYNPAVGALVDRLQQAFGDRCLPRELVPDPTTGLLPCSVVEATLSTSNVCDSSLGRGEVSSDVVSAVREQLQASGACGVGTDQSCDSYQLCEIEQLTGADLRECQSLGAAAYPSSGLPGYCYVDPQNGVGSADVVAGCPESQPRKLEFVGADTPRAGSMLFITCSGVAFSD